MNSFPTASEAPQNSLRTAKRKFLLAAAKLLGVLTTAFIPALVGWIDTSAQAGAALTAAATEQAVSEAAYAEMQRDITALRIKQAVLEDRIGRLAAIYGQHRQRSTDAGAATEEAQEAPASPARALPDVPAHDMRSRVARPSAGDDAVAKIRRAYLQQY